MRISKIQLSHIKQAILSRDKYFLLILSKTQLEAFKITKVIIECLGNIYYLKLVDYMKYTNSEEYICRFTLSRKETKDNYIKREVVCIK